MLCLYQNFLENTETAVRHFQQTGRMLPSPNVSAHVTQWHRSRPQCVTVHEAALLVSQPPRLAVHARKPPAPAPRAT